MVWGELGASLEEVCVKNVCVYCGSRKGEDPAWEAAARALGREMAGRGMGLVFGGGAVGLMGVIADEILSAGGEVVGVIPWGLSSTEVTNEAVTELIHCDTMHERKALMEQRSDGFIAMPGGYGTLDELFEILTWSQLGLHRKPVGVFNTGGFFDHLLAYLDETTARGFISRAHRDIIKASADPAEMLDAMEAYEPEHGAIWSVEP